MNPSLFQQFAETEADNLFVLKSVDEARFNERTQEAASEAKRATRKSDIIAAKRILKVRRRREEMLPRTLFAEPAWDILLDLFIASEEGRHMSICDAGIAGKVPYTTALRTISRLEEAGLISRQADPCDQRRFFLTMSADTLETVRDLVRI